MLDDHEDPAEELFEDFVLELTSGLTILVGDNNAGKSTLVEAIRLALTGRLGDRWLWNTLSPYLFNQQTAAAWAEAVQAGQKPPPPEMNRRPLPRDDGRDGGSAGHEQPHARAAGLRVRTSDRRRRSTSAAANTVRL